MFGGQQQAFSGWQRAEAGVWRVAAGAQRELVQLPHFWSDFDVAYAKIFRIQSSFR